MTLLLAGCETVPPPGAWAASQPNAIGSATPKRRSFAAACPGALKPATFVWLASKVELDKTPGSLAAGNDILRQDQEAEVCREKRS